MDTLTGHAIDRDRHCQTAFGIGKAGRGLLPTVAESPHRGMASVAVGDGLDAVAALLDDNTQTPIDLVPEGVVVEARALARYERLDGLRQQ